jgi:isoleucyl-tRNA synthetase
LSNQHDPQHLRFDPASDAVSYGEMLEIDRWALARTARLIKRCVKGYEDYQFHLVYSALYNFCTVDLSAFYLDVLKDRLYTHATRSASRRSAQTALWHILNSFTRLIAPILPFTAEEILDAMYEGCSPRERPASVHVLLFPPYEANHDREVLLVEWDRLLEVRQAVSKALEELRQTGAIGNSLEARVTIRAGGDTAALLRRHEQELRYILIVSQVELVDDSGSELRVEAGRAQGEKCERCWNYSAKTGENADFPTICERCVAHVKEMYS